MILILSIKTLEKPYSLLVRIIFISEKERKKQGKKEWKKKWKNQ